MFKLTATLENERLVIAGLNRMGRKAPEAVRAGLTSAVIAIHNEAFDRLGGSGSKKSNVPAGTYPVPRRTSNLLEHLDFVPPGQSKTANGITFKAGSSEAIVYNAAPYAAVISEGKGTSSIHGPRPFITDAVKVVDVAGKIEKEIKLITN